MSKFFDELMESVQQMDEIVRGERQPSRQFIVDSLQVKKIRKATGLTQAKSAGWHTAFAGKPAPTFLIFISR